MNVLPHYFQYTIVLVTEISFCRILSSEYIRWLQLYLMWIKENLVSDIVASERFCYMKAFLMWLPPSRSKVATNNCSYMLHRYRSLIERALRARLVYGSPNMNRAVSFEYMNRQLVWNEFSVNFLISSCID